MNEWVSENGVNFKVRRFFVLGVLFYIVYDGIESVGDGEDGIIVELRSDGRLNEVVCF